MIPGAEDEPLSRTGELAAGIAGFMVAAVLLAIAVDLITGGALSGLLASRGEGE